MPTFSRLLRGHFKPSSCRSGSSCCKTLPVALHEGSAKRVSPSPYHPQLRCRGRPASPELSVAQTSPLSPAVPARPSPHTPRTLSNPLGSRWLLREETLSRTGAGTTGLQAGRRRDAGYGEPSNEARAGAQRRQVLAEYDQGAAAVAAGAQGPLHHWQPWSPSIFLPQAGALARHTSSGSKGPALEPFRRAAGRVLVWRVCASPILFPRSRIVLTPLLSRPGREGATSSSCSFLGSVGGQTCWCSHCSRCRSKNESNSITSFGSQEPATAAATATT
ncbi:uncharacterized protein AAES06_022113 [Glossophaga mutica]